MFWALASSAFVIYLYRKLNATNRNVPDSANPLDRELDALNAQVSKLEGEIEKAIGEVTKP